MKSLVAPILRSAVQALVGAVLAYLAVRGLNVPADVATQVTVGLTAVLTGLLAKAQHLAEARFPALASALHSPSYPAAVDFGALEQALRELGLFEAGVDPETGDPLSTDEKGTPASS